MEGQAACVGMNVRIQPGANHQAQSGAGDWLLKLQQGPLLPGALAPWGVACFPVHLSTTFCARGHGVFAQVLLLEEVFSGEVEGIKSGLQVKVRRSRAEEERAAHDCLMAHGDMELGLRLQGAPEVRDLFHRDEGCVNGVQRLRRTDQPTFQELGVKLGDTDAQSISLHGRGDRCVKHLHGLHFLHHLIRSKRENMRNHEP